MEQTSGRGKVDRLAGLRVLLVEDRGLIAGKIARVLQNARCVVVGPAPTLQAGFDLLATDGDGLGAAVLDIDLRGELVYPLAEALQAKGVPLLFITGFAASALPDRWKGTQRIDKPFRDTAFLVGFNAALSGETARPPPGAGFASSSTFSRAVITLNQTRNLIEENRILRGSGPLERE